MDSHTRSFQKPIRFTVVAFFVSSFVQVQHCLNLRGLDRDHQDADTVKAPPKLTDGTLTPGGPAMFAFGSAFLQF
jgi:hypothetical protein